MNNIFLKQFYSRRIAHFLGLSDKLKNQSKVSENVELYNAQQVEDLGKQLNFVLHFLNN